MPAIGPHATGVADPQRAWTTGACALGGAPSGGAISRSKAAIAPRVIAPIPFFASTIFEAST